MNAAPNALAQTEDFEFAALELAQNYRRALVFEFSEFLKGQVLEVGAGIGQITKELLQNKQITRLVSIEPDARFYVRLKAACSGHETIQGTVDAVAKDQPWNAILNINVLEHIENDCRELAAYSRLLSGQRGYLCLFVPARPEIYAPIDKDFGHFRRYTREELSQKLNAAGFEVVRLRYFNFAGYFAWWFNFCILKQREFGRGSVRFYDRVIFPVVHGFENNVMHPPFGQSLLAVARAR